MKFRIGHSAYQGENAPADASSKAQAVRILRERGLTRDDARAAVNKAATGAYITVRGPGFSVIEMQGFHN